MRFKITALEKTPKLKGTYCVTSFPNELENVLKKIIPNLDDVTVYLISFSDFLVDNLEVEVFEDTDVPTEENKNGFSLNICENPDEIFDGIEDMSFFSEVDDIWYEEDGKTKEFPPELKQKLISDFDGEVEQQDYEVEVIGKMKVEELISAAAIVTDKDNFKKIKEDFLLYVKQNSYYDLKNLVKEYPELREDKTLFLEGMKLNGSSVIEFGKASSTLRKDKDFILSAVKIDGAALRLAHSSLMFDREIVLEAVKNFGNALSYAESMGGNENFKDDREIVLEAIKQDGSALQFASKRLKKDVELKKIAKG